MIQSIKAMCRQWKSNFDQFMFTLGYLCAALAIGTTCHIKGICKHLRHGDKASKELYDSIDALYEQGDQAFDIFLNRVRPILTGFKREKPDITETGFP